MELATIKSILKDNKEYLKGKSLQVGYDTYSTFNEFVSAISELSKNKKIGLSMVLTTNDFERCSSDEDSLRNAFNTTRFDAVKIFSFVPSKKTKLPKGITIRDFLTFQVPLIYNLK